MKWYLILFRYNSKWHIDIMTRESAYNVECERDRQWLCEAVRFSISNRDLYLKGKNRIYDISLHEITCNSEATDLNKIVELKNVPTDAMECVIILNDN